MALVNSLKPEWNWYASRFQLKKDIATYIVFPEDCNVSCGDFSCGTLYPYCISIEDYVHQNEARLNISDSCMLQIQDLKLLRKMYFREGYFISNPYIAATLGKKAERIKKYNQIIQAYNSAVEKNLRSREEVKGDLNEMLEAQLEHINLVRVPFLGISFDVNLLGFYGGLTLAGLYLLLYFSLVREHRNLKILFRKAWADDRFHNYFFYEYVSMHQVLSVPKKLFEKNRSNESWLRNIPFLGFIIPGLIQFFVVLYDADSYDRGTELNPSLTDLSFNISRILLIPIIYLIYKISTRLKRIDALWDAQAIQYNLEFILENLGEDPVLDFNEFEKKLKPADLPLVMNYWYYLIKRLSENGPDISEKAVHICFNKFIGSCYKNSFSNKVPSYAEEQEKVLECWKSFKLWFENTGKKKIDYKFYISFIVDFLKLKHKKSKFNFFR